MKKAEKQACVYSIVPFFLPDSDTCGMGEWCFVVITVGILVTMVGELVSALVVVARLVSVAVMFDRPGVAGAVLQTASSLIH